ncbi:MAG: MFS transporter [Candidatus Pacebacteria bacterium]|nr:MFS transporter [Candidatus Paceibacterota bacterium]
MKLSRKHYTLLIILITEVLGWSLILPFLPFYAQSLGATKFQVGLLLTSFSLFQFVTAPIMGGLSDKFGRRPLLIFSQLTTALSFTVLGLANSLPLLFVSRIMDGFLGANGTIAQAYLGDITSKKDRSKAFGITGVAFSVGFMIGPALGGFLSQISYSIPALIAAGLSLLSLIFTYFFLPETITKKPDHKLEFTIFDLEQFKKYWQVPAIRQQLIEFSTYILAQVLLSSNFALIADDRFGFGPKQVGIIMAYIGVVSIVLRGILIPKMIDRWNERSLERVAGLSMMTGLIGLSWASQMSQLILVISFFAFGSGLLRPLMMGDISRSVNKNEQGKIMGITSSLGSLAQIFGPLVGSFLISQSHPNSVLLLAATILSLGIYLVFQERKDY